MIAVLVLYVTIAIAGFFIAAETLNNNKKLSKYFVSRKQQSQIAALVILTSWVWPIWIPIFIIRYIREAIHVLTGRND